MFRKNEFIDSNFLNIFKMTASNGKWVLYVAENKVKIK